MTGSPAYAARTAPGGDPDRPRRGGQQQWRTTRRWAASPRSGTPSTGDRPAGQGRRALLRGADGRGGLQQRLEPALPPQHPVHGRASTASGPSATWPRPPTTRCCRGTSSRTTSSPPKVVKDTDVVTGRRLLLGNGDVRLSYVVAGAPSPWYRNGIGDECVYVERGRARVETVFGAFEVGEGDYVIIPRATTHRWIPKRSGKDPLRTICIEAQQPHRATEALPQQVRPAARAQPRTASATCALPQGPLLAEDVGENADADTEVYIKHRGGGPASSGGIVGTVHVLPFHPLDVVGWDGCLYPYVFNVSDYEPITGRIHQPPPAHQVFEGWNFVVCNFVPRKVDYHPLSIPVPYYHSNVDSDEVMFYVDGDYEARKGSGIGQGLDLAAPRRPRPRAAAGSGGGLDRQGLLRRARRHGRHLPPARAR